MVDDIRWLQRFEHIENKALIEHILRVGKKIYKKQTKEIKC